MIRTHKIIHWDSAGHSFGCQKGIVSPDWWKNDAM